MSNDNKDTFNMSDVDASLPAAAAGNLPQSHPSQIFILLITSRL